MGEGDVKEDGEKGGVLYVAGVIEAVAGDCGAAKYGGKGAQYGGAVMVGDGNKTGWKWYNLNGF